MADNRVQQARIPQYDFLPPGESLTFALMLDPAASRLRQRRLLPGMAERNLDAFVVGLPAHVYYLSAFQTFWQQQSALIVVRDGRSILVAAAGAVKDRKEVAADKVEE